MPSEYWTSGFIGLVKVNDDRLGRLAARDAVEAARDAVAQHSTGWTLHILEGTHPFVIPVAVTYDRPPAERNFPDSIDLFNFLRSLPHPVALVADLMLVPTPGHKGSGPTPHRHAFTRGDLDRVPVHVLAEPRPRISPQELGSRRRPVVVLLDTKVQKDPQQPHPWLELPGKELGDDAFWVDAATLGWDPGVRLNPCPPLPPPPERELGDGEGHGTFSAGLIRQVAPDVQVLAVQVIPDDGDVYGDHVLNALAWVGDERVLAPGDVVCLPACFRPQLPTDNAFQHWLAEATLRLGDGVTLVAPAGNDGSDELVYPAAFTTWPKGSTAPTDSVGARNPDGKTKAYYSNFGNWVTCWEVGTSLVSTFPGINGARAPELTSGDRRSTDPDDFTGGFARWSGTSFAAAVHAGKLAQQQLPAALQER